MSDDNLNIHTRLAIVEKDLVQLTNFLGKLENTMEKLAGVLSALKETIILHDMKLTNQEKNEISDSSTIKELNKRLSVLEQFRWYATGAIALLAVAFPFMMKLFFKL